ncbi:MAG: aminotransferase class V-fold PLP-dependent enzyme [Bacteroidota bacterium]
MHFSSQEIQQFRADTSGTQFVTHFNHAGSSLPPDVVLHRQLDYIHNEHRMGGYEAMVAFAHDSDGVYQALAQYLNAAPEEIALAESATVAWYKAFRAIDWREGDQILVAQSTYGTNYLAYLQAQEQLGIEFKVIPNDRDGVLDLTALEAAIGPKTRMLALTHLPTNGGLVNPAEEVGALAAKHGLLYLLDACQSAGQMPLDVKALNCDFLSATGRKFLRGPRGTGFLYVKQALIEQLEPPMVDIYGAEWDSLDGYTLNPGAKRFENFEFNRANRIGLGAAVSYFLQVGPARAWGQIQRLAAELRQGLEAIPGIEVHDLGRIRSGIVTFTSQHHTPDQIKAHLAAHRVNVSLAWMGSARLDLERRGLSRLVRASVHYFNTEEEIDELLSLVKAL